VARTCVEVYGADFICLKLLSTNPEEANVSAEDAASLVSTVLAQVKAPLIIQGSGDYDKDAASWNSAATPPKENGVCSPAGTGQLQIDRRCGDR